MWSLKTYYNFWNIIWHTCVGNDYNILSSDKPDAITCMHMPHKWSQFNSIAWLFKLASSWDSISYYITLQLYYMPGNDVLSITQPSHDSVWSPHDLNLKAEYPHTSLLLQFELTVSVCQNVSTIAHLESPTTLWYQSQASGLIGSPTLPRTRKDFRLYLKIYAEIIKNGLFIW